MMALLLAVAATQMQTCAKLAGPTEWAYEQPQYPNIGANVTLHRKGGNWSAALGLTSLTIRWTGNHVHLRGPTGAKFDGYLRRGIIDGFWIEPKTALDHARAFRMTLRSAGRGRWHGPIGAREERLTLQAWYLPKADGTEFLIRNPDGLVGDFRFKANDQGCTLALTNMNNARHHATLRIDQDGGAKLEGLTPDLPSVHLGRPTSERAGPVSASNDWPTAPPSSVGIDPASLERLFASVHAIDPSDRGVPLIHSILVARRGKLVAERYFGGYDASRLAEMRSTSKTFASLLVGAARAHGITIGSGTPIAPSLPAYRALFAAEPAKSKISLGNLLAMRPGLACDDFDDASPGGEDVMQHAPDPDWYRYFLRLPRLHAPGEHYAYCSGATHVAAGVVAGAAHRSARSLFDSWLAAPLGITEYSMPLDPEGRAYFGGGMHLRARDLLKFGQLVLDHGRWKGREIVDPAWLEESTHCPAKEPDCAEGLGWHFNQVSVNGRKYREIEANGNGGQLLMLFPELDLAVVFTAANFNAYPIWRKFREELTPQYILSAIGDQALPTTLSGKSSPNTR